MRGPDAQTGSLFSYVDLEARVPEAHPLRAIRGLVDAALVDLSPAFARPYAPLGRPSIPPERPVRALLLQAFYSVRSERQLMEQLGYNPLFRRFVGLGVDDPAWDVTVFTKNRARLLEGDIAREFLAAVLSRPEVRALSSDEHFSVDGTLLQARASLKSFRPRDGSGEPPAPRRGATASATSTARSARTPRTPRPPMPRRGSSARQGPRQGGEAPLHGPCADGEPPRAGGRWPGEPGHRHGRAGRGGGGDDDRGDPGPAPDHGGRRQAPRHARLGRPVAGAGRHAARGPEHQRPAAPGDRRDGRTTRHPGYELSQRARKRIEEAFGWIKGVALLRRARHRGKDRIGWRFTLAAAYNLIRLPKLLGAA